MIGLILGTSEGKKILSLLNNYTDNIFVSTATEYGGELLKQYKYKVMNTKPLGLEELISALRDNNVTLLVDASHPYAQVVTDNAIEACRILGIEYLRYERQSVSEAFDTGIIRVKNYEELHKELLKIDGLILNTTGSRNIDKFVNMNLKNRIIHRVLPSVEVLERCFSLGVKTEDIVAIKGPIGYDLNCAFIKEYNAKAIVMKDSGSQGGTEEKLKAAKDMGIKVFVIERAETKYDKAFSTEAELVEYIVKNINLNN